ncbi:MAG: PAS domain S-box protein [Armatimonadetes bacterium]|nr:PAS domain S-box protein [Armatimonadota bacterium]
MMPDALRRCRMLDAKPEPAYDDLARLAARVCQAPVGAIVFTDESGVHLKSCVGGELEMSPAMLSFQGPTTPPDGIRTVCDPFQDERFASHPCLCSGRPIRFFACAPLLTPDGCSSGALVVMDFSPRTLASEQEESLLALARQATARLELQRRLKETEAAVVQKDALKREMEERIRERTDALDRSVCALQAEMAERIKSEESLRTNEKRYRILAEAAHDFIFIISRDGYVEYVNSFAAAQFRCCPEDLIGKPRAQLFPPSIAERQQENLQKVLDTGQPLYVEDEALFPDGNIWLGSWLAPIRSDSGEITAVLGLSRDITERRQAEDALQEVHVSLERRVEEQTAELARANERLKEQLAERLRVEENLRHSEEQLKIMFEYAPVGYYLSNTRGTFITGNRAAEQIAGYAKEELIGKSFLKLNLLPPSEIPKAAIRLVRNILGHPTGPDEVVLNRKDGSQATLEIHTYPVKINDQSLVLGVVRDITERKQAEEELRQAHQLLEQRVREQTAEIADANIQLQRDLTERRRIEGELRRANDRLESTMTELQDTQQQLIRQERLRALEQIASGVAHELNNHLATILGFSELLLMRPADPASPKEARYLNAIHTATQDAAKVVGRLREFYRHRKAGDHLEPVDLTRLIEQVILLTQPRWHDQAQAKGLSISVRAEGQPLAVIAANEAELREMLTNLIFNAVDAMPLGGEITIRTRAEAAHAILEISDTGIGMADSIREICMEPFFSTKGEQGTGLGLAIVYGIVQRHEGRIDILSQPGAGTTFTIRLPWRSKALRPGPQKPLEPVAYSLDVLVVEDKPMVLEFVAESLAGKGHRITTAADGRQGLERFQAGAFDLVVTDRAMPEMNGDQLAAAIKSLSPGTPVILLTGFGDFMIAADDRPEGVDIVLSKPITPVQLLDAIHRVTRNRA